MPPKKSPQKPHKKWAPTATPFERIKQGSGARVSPDILSEKERKKVGRKLGGHFLGRMPDKPIKK